MQTLNITEAVSHSIGNVSPTDISVNDSIDSNIDEIKICESGDWDSWTKGAPAEFQGFDTLNSGKGYILKNSGSTTITLPEGRISYESLVAPLGLNTVAIPRTVEANSTLNWEASEIKEVTNSFWSSWNEGAPDEFQGFTTMEADKGYLVNITNVNYSSSSYIPYGMTLRNVGYLTEVNEESELIDNDLKLVLSTRRQEF